jgi:DNA modification methylase
LSNVRIINADVMDGLAALEDASVHCVVTSPPYFGLRDYGVAGQIGLEDTVFEFVEKLVTVFAEVRRVLRPDGTLWLNLGDSYASAWPAPNTRRNIIGNPMNGGRRGPQRKNKLAGSLKEKDLMGVPWRVAFALQAEGWYLRSDIIWSKPNPMPESVTDRPTKAHEYIFLMTKSAKYSYDADAIKEQGSQESVARRSRADLRQKAGYAEAHFGNPPVRAKQRRAKLVGRDRESQAGFNERWDGCTTRNARSVWTITTKPYKAAHFATFPETLAEKCIKAGCPEGGVVLDPFGGAGTTGLVAAKLGRDAVLIELNPEYAKMAENRILAAVPLLTTVELDVLRASAG